MIRTRDDPVLELSRSHHRKSHKDHHFPIQQHEHNVYVNDPTQIYQIRTNFKRFEAMADELKPESTVKSESLRNIRIYYQIVDRRTIHVDLMGEFEHE